MKRIILVVLILVAGAAVFGWFRFRDKLVATATKQERKVLYYQSSMHPWIKSDKPGKCTICGMELTPVFEGQTGISLDPSMVTLGSNIVNVINVKTETVERRQLTRTLQVAGTLEDNDTKHRFISAYVDGRIEKLAINYVGAEVTKGEPLATLYSPALSTAQREYLALVRSRKENEALDPLIKGAANRLERLGLSAEQVKRLTNAPSSTVDILAPESGTVIQRFVYEGQYVKEGEKLFELADFSTMWFRFDAYEQDLSWLKIGQAVEVTVSSVPGKTFKGPISFIEPNIQDQSRTARVRVELENPVVEQNGKKRRELFHRVFASGSVAVDSPETLTVSRAAVLNAGSKPVVYVEKEEGTYEQRVVKLGRVGDERWEILEGVSEGEKVVARGNLLVDSQAQLNQSVQPKAEAVPTMQEKLPELSAEQISSLEKFFAEAAKISEALAADDLGGFNAALEAVNNAIKNLHVVMGTHPLSGEAHLLAEAPLVKAADLEGARRQFYPFTKSTVSLAEKSRRNFKAFKQVKVFKCPMAPKPGQTSFWLQLKLPLRNPFNGAEMLECGNEVKL